MAANALKAFHPITRNWFTARYGDPTAAQADAWPLIVEERHILLTAPTGTGKTLAAFLWPIDQLATGLWPKGTTSVLYISPLKALNNDIQRNLLGPLAELCTCFEQAGESWHEPRVMTRSGDTSVGERRQMLRHPPEILITTPESLNLLLTSKGGVIA